MLYLSTRLSSLSVCLFFISAFFVFFLIITLIFFIIYNHSLLSFFFFLKHPAPPNISPLPLHDAFPISSVFFVYNNEKNLVGRGTGPYIYIQKRKIFWGPRLWNDVFDYTEKALNLPRASIKCSVLIETILAAFQMEEILHSLRERITALNFGRWDYIFSLIKFLGEDPKFVVPERPLLPMTAP